MNRINIYGQIGMSITDEAFMQKLSKCKGDLKVHINSPGGSVFHGYAMYNALKEYDGTVTVHIDGVAASMASVICLAGDKIVMANNAIYMIHNPRSYKGGESKDLRHEADVLDKVKDIMIEAYKSKTGMNNKIIASMMDNETWLKPDEAHKMGFVDEIKNKVFSRKLNHVAVTPNQVYACFVNNN